MINLRSAKVIFAQYLALSGLATHTNAQIRNTFLFNFITFLSVLRLVQLHSNLDLSRLLCQGFKNQEHGMLTRNK